MEGSHETEYSSRSDAGIIGEDMQETYVDIMIQSLNKKLSVLDKIIEVNISQKEILENTKAPIEEFDKTVEEKAKLIEQMQQLDSGFEKLYERVQEALKSQKEE